MIGIKDTATQGRRILVVEDDFLVAQTVCDMLEQAGALIVGPIGWLADAVAFVQGNSDDFDCAVLDINLHGEKSYPVADVLAGHDIPFVFTTGYGVHVIDGPYRDCPHCEKPFSQRDLFAALSVAAERARRSGIKT